MSKGWAVAIVGMLLIAVASSAVALTISLRPVRQVIVATPPTTPNVAPSSEAPTVLPPTSVTPLAATPGSTEVPQSGRVPPNGPHPTLTTTITVPRATVPVVTLPPCPTGKAKAAVDSFEVRPDLAPHLYVLHVEGHVTNASDHAVAGSESAPTVTAYDDRNFFVSAVTGSMANAFDIAPGATVAFTGEIHFFSETLDRHPAVRAAVTTFFFSWRDVVGYCPTPVS